MILQQQRPQMGGSHDQQQQMIAPQIHPPHMHQIQPMPNGGGSASGAMRFDGPNMLRGPMHAGPQPSHQGLGPQQQQFDIMQPSQHPLPPHMQQQPPPGQYHSGMGPASTMGPPQHHHMGPPQQPLSGHPHHLHHQPMTHQGLMGPPGSQQSHTHLMTGPSGSDQFQAMQPPPQQQSSSHDQSYDPNQQMIMQNPVDFGQPNVVSGVAPLSQAHDTLAFPDLVDPMLQFND